MIQARKWQYLFHPGHDHGPRPILAMIMTRHPPVHAFGLGLVRPDEEVIPPYVREKRI
jgi:hypothetical protein